MRTFLSTFATLVALVAVALMSGDLLPRALLPAAAVLITITAASLLSRGSRGPGRWSRD